MNESKARSTYCIIEKSTGIESIREKCSSTYLYATSVLQIGHTNIELLLMARNRISSKMENTPSS